MQKFDVRLLLEENKWVSAVELSDPGVNKENVQILVDISADGHELIRDTGMREFDKLFQKRLSGLGLDGIGWGIRPVCEDIWGQDISGEGQKFPRVLSRTGDASQQQLLLDISTDIGWFEGHFPGKPVLAGVVQLHWAVCSSRTLLKFNGVPGDIKRLKFKAIVSPPGVIELKLNKLGEYEVQFEYSSLGQLHSLGRLVFQEDIEC